MLSVFAALLTSTMTDPNAFADFEVPADWQAPTIPTIEIAKGVHLPMVLLGTWLYNDTVAHDAATAALKLDYPGIDTAYDYKNGKGLGLALKESGKARHEYWITSKVEGGLSFNDTIREAMSQLHDLQVPYIDLLLIHFPFHGNGKPFTPEGRAEQWEAMEHLHRTGKVRSIGVSHFCRHHMEKLLATAKIKPAVNQVEYHIGMGSAGGNATDDKDYMQASKITYQPFSELCGPCCMGQPATCTYNKELITGKLVTDIGKRHDKSGAQVSLKWLVQQGLPVIPKSNNPHHLMQNLELFGPWTLSKTEMDVLTRSPTPPVCGGGDGKTSGDCGFP